MSSRLVSVSTNGGVGDGMSTDAVMTSDGRFVAFVSAFTNLVADDTNGIADVFVRDLVNLTTALVSVGAVPAPGSSNTVNDSLGITPDGRFVTFFSSARGLAAGVTNTSRGEIYVRDLVGSTTTWVSSNVTALVRSVMQFTSEPVPSHPVISDDGRYVAFKSGWTNGTVAIGGTTAATVIMRFDSTTSLTTLIATNGLPPWAQNTDVNGPEMTPDGRFIAFVATNRQPYAMTVRLWDAQTGSNTLVSVAQDGSFPTNSVSDSPAVSPDGRFVVFVSNATNLTGNAVSNGFHVYLRDMQAGTTQLMDADTNGTGSFECAAVIPSLSTNGAWIAFSCRQWNQQSRAASFCPRCGGCDE
jgi:TolB protein